MDQTKMTVKIYEPLLRHFSQQANGLHLKRDAFLNSMIRREVAHLAEDLKGKRLSNPARRYIAGKLKRLGTIPVNLVVDKSTARMLNRVVSKSNIVRDAFINRLLLFLRASDRLLAYLDLPAFVAMSEFRSWVERMPTGPLKAMEAVHADPLYYLRVSIEERHDTGLYLVLLPEKFHGFSCYLDDALVPNTAAYANADQELKDMLKGIDILERESFAIPGARQ